MYRWQQVARRLRSDICEGTLHRAGRLPPCKVLQEEYAVDYRTLRKALAHLTAANLLAPQRRGYRIVRTQRSHAGNAVVFITPSDLRTESRLRIAPFSLLEFVRILENECSRRRLRLVPGSVYGGRDDLGTLLRREAPYGIIVHCPAPGPLTAALQGCPHAPVAIFDNFAGYRLASTEWFHRNQRALSLQIDQHAVGRAAAACLLKHGHRSVVFVSAYRGRDFASRRLQGLADAFREAGDGRTVTLCENAADTGKRLPPAAALEALPATDVPRRLVELFDGAMQMPKVSAWVCANDPIAVRALGYLERNGVRVPGGLSVVGFDNSAGAVFHRLTSYDFDLPGFCLAMLNHIVDPQSHAALPAERRVVFRTGMLIERETTAPPGQAA